MGINQPTPNKTSFERSLLWPVISLPQPKHLVFCPTDIAYMCHSIGRTPTFYGQMRFKKVGRSIEVQPTLEIFLKTDNDTFGDEVKRG